ncbi:MAG: AMP-binding protein, partial [Alphaproteobacteria bacterium]|nr:AMP-binding protein [Alphaproteobacteria bacterium]
MPNANLFAILRSRFPDDRQAVFLESPDGAVLRYGEADDLSARMAATLRGLGVAPGERVVAQVEKSPAAVGLYLACLRVG